ncbi:LysE family translocator [Neptuniibacter halophilus]|uniref:LysE family translocator n=1 Tax=Neptuniibacter halophilus TaxID=651666 RepID=UPI002572F9A4|nr:LysE family translocator [Neptuniibacter halophilus]
MLTVLGSMCLFALVGAITPGPVNIIATSAGASYGFLRTLPHVLGATVSYTLIVFTVGAGLNQILADLPSLTDLLKYPGSAFLLYMAYKIATAEITTEQHEEQAAAPGFVHGALSQGLNPKAWLVSMSGVSVLVLSQNDAQFYLLAFCLISFVLCFIGVATWAATGHLIRGFLRQPERQRSFNRFMGVLLSLTVLPIVLH